METDWSEFIAKQVPSARLVFETRAKCQDFVARNKDDGIPDEIDSPFCSAKTTGRSESNLCLCGWRLTNTSKFSPSMEMTKVHLSARRSTPTHKFSALRIEETMENLCSNLPHIGSGQLFALVAPDLCIPRVTCETLQRILSQASTAKV